MDSKLTDMDAKLSIVQGRQRELDGALRRLRQSPEGGGGGGGGGPAPEEGEGASDSDRKRLKERFLKALALDKGPLADIPKAAGAWVREREREGTHTHIEEREKESERDKCDRERKRERE